ncbi:SDR family oxidoreductase [Salinisphaera sp. SWV1]|uniref:SDR family oxidoreductase n=1 Tax=Salinisphaera sp. SWV1 TaxID=3454139 RepID=UPI003F859D93
MTASDKICLITGAAQGIGRAIARRLMTDGHIVWCLDRDSAALEDLRADPGNCAHANNVFTTVADVACEADIQAATAAIRDRHGRLDLVVNNAGIAAPFNGPVEQLALADWHRVIDVNLTGVFLVTKHTVPLLRGRPNAAIVNMASSRAYQSEPQTEAYAAAKGGIETLTHALAMSLGPAIRVNAVAPGWIDVRGEQAGADVPPPLRAVDHAQHPTGRVGIGADIAGVVAFLAGPDAPFITGQTLIADGGMTRKMIYAH